VGLPELVDQVRSDACSWGSQGVPDGNGPPIGITLLWVQTQHLGNRKVLSSKRLIHLRESRGDREKDRRRQSRRKRGRDRASEKEAKGGSQFYQVSCMTQSKPKQSNQISATFCISSYLWTYTSTRSMSWRVRPAFFRASVMAGTGPDGGEWQNLTNRNHLMAMLERPIYWDVSYVFIKYISHLLSVTHRFP
jgi:hypothetical protein